MATYFFTLGVIMEHGILVHETAAKRLGEKFATPRRHWKTSKRDK